ncbi:hypothetical protein JCM5296_001703 [Sporobolomyces johnsonii]
MPTRRSRLKFLERLAALFESRKDKGSVFITQKRFTYNDGTSATAAPATSASAHVEAGDDDVAMTVSPSSSSTSPQTEYPLLVRATDGRSKKDIKVKLSTIVHPSAYATFTDHYTSLLRSQLSSALRPKRKRSAASKPKPKKLKAKATAGGSAREDDVEVETPRGGAGAGGGGAGFVVRLPKVVGPRRGNGVKKRRRAERRREKAVARIQKAREERKRRAAGASAGAGGAA